MKTHFKHFLWVLAVAGTSIFIGCSDDSGDNEPEVDKTELLSAIEAANDLLETSEEGTAEGQYLMGAKAELQDAIDLAQQVADSETVTQTQVDNAVTALEQAIAVFESKEVVPIEPDALVGHWTFDGIESAEVGATVKDYSGNSNDGTMKAGHEFWGGGIPELAEDRYGNAAGALYFNEGSNVEIPYSTTLNPGNITISLWMKQDVNDPIVNNQYMVAMDRWNCYKFNMQDVPKPFFTVNPQENPGAHINEDSAEPSEGLTQGSWYHIAVTFGEGHMSFYVDGEVTKVWDHEATILNISDNPVNLVFGQDLPSDGYSLNEADPNYLNWGGYFIGAMDEIRIYNKVLSATQINSIYELEKVPEEE